MAALTEHQHDELLIPASAYAEILVAPHRRGAQAVAEVEAFLSDLSIRLEVLTPAIARAAAKLRSESRSLRLPDALVLATAEELGADVALTDDESWTRRLHSPASLVHRAPRARWPALSLSARSASEPAAPARALLTGGLVEPRRAGYETATVAVVE